MKRHLAKATGAVLIVLAAGTAYFLNSGTAQQPANQAEARLPAPERHAVQMIKEGRLIFRYDTFGDEEFWSDALKLNQAIVGKKLGGAANDGAALRARRVRDRGRRSRA